jgi:hypothetical protein
MIIRKANNPSSENRLLSSRAFWTQLGITERVFSHCLSLLPVRAELLEAASSQYARSRKCPRASEPVPRRL